MGWEPLEQESRLTWTVYHYPTVSIAVWVGEYGVRRGEPQNWHRVEINWDWGIEQSPALFFPFPGGISSQF